MDIQSYCEKLGSTSPAPGGGSAAGIVLSLAASCIEKSIRFSIKDDNEFVGKTETIRKSGLELSNMDQTAFNNWSDARKLPKENDEQKEYRKNKINELIIDCINVPAGICKKSVELMEMAFEFLPVCNKFLVSDVAVGASFCFSAFESGIFNIMINLPYLKNEEMKKDFLEYIEKSTGRMKELRDNILSECSERINSST